MQNVHLLATLYKLQPVQAGLTKQLHTPRSHRILALASRLMAALRRSHRRRVAMRALEALSDWQLKDIGVERADIRAVVDQQLKAGPPLPKRNKAARPSIGTGASAAQGATNDDTSQIAA